GIDVLYQALHGILQLVSDQAVERCGHRQAAVLQCQLPVVDVVNEAIVKRKSNQLQTRSRRPFIENGFVQVKGGLCVLQGEIDDGRQGKRNTAFKKGLPVVYVEPEVVIVDVPRHLDKIIQQIGERTRVDLSGISQQGIHYPLLLAGAGVILKRVYKALTIHGEIYWSLLILFFRPVWPPRSDNSHTHNCISNWFRVWYIPP